ncbi:MAG: cell division protein FtsZ, partial [Firmicutes bacterium]|nr:cell division protein FtsZ [Bacillota bacterium]
AVNAAQMAINSPLLDTSIEGAGQILINVCGGPDMGILEYEEVMDSITKMAAPDADIIIGTSTDENMEDELLVTVIATDFSSDRNTRIPTPESFVQQPQPARPQAPQYQPEVPKAPAPQAPAPDTSYTQQRPSESVDMPIDIPMFLQNRRKD